MLRAGRLSYGSVIRSKGERVFEESERTFGDGIQSRPLTRVSGSRTDVAGAEGSEMIVEIQKGVPHSR